MKPIFIALGITAIITISAVPLINKAVSSREVTECRQWQEYAAEYHGFYLTLWQNEQCKAHSIQINAPVKIKQ